MAGPRDDSMTRVKAIESRHTEKGEGFEEAPTRLHLFRPDHLGLQMNLLRWCVDGAGRDNLRNLVLRQAEPRCDAEAVCAIGAGTMLDAAKIRFIDDSRAAGPWKILCEPRADAFREALVLPMRKPTANEEYRQQVRPAGRHRILLTGAPNHGARLHH